LFVWVTLLAAIFLKEKLRLPYLLGFIVIVFANFFFIPQLKLGFSTGEIFVLSATLLWSIENILAKKVLKTVAPETVGLLRMGIGRLILVSFVFFQGKTALFFKLTLSQWLMIFTGATLLFFYVFSWYKALKFLPASLATLIPSVATVIGSLFSAFVISIPFSSRELTQLILYFFAFVIIFFDQKEILSLCLGKK
jgi:drug/metabolite transporter (DMT)-like permease